MLTSMNERFDIGIVGAGQLARMMVQAAISLGLRVRVLAESPADSAALVWPDIVIGSPNDPEVVASFAEACNVVTFDHELVPPKVLAVLTVQRATLRPNPKALALAQDKLWQREQFARRGLPVPRFHGVRSIEDVAAFAIETGWPVAVKTAVGGYDGRGVWRVASAPEAAELFASLPARGTNLIAEAWVPIDREVAAMVARSPAGEVATYPVVDTLQIDGICREIVAPAGISAHLSDKATALAIDVAKAIDLTGVMALELFVAGDELFINEIATRPHNSGHYTIEGCTTSQFEQHLRAVMDLPLGSTDLTAEHVVTVNVLGGPTGEDPRQTLAQALALPGVNVHLYGKSARPGRKLGHVTVLGENLEEARERAWLAAGLLTGERVESPR
jgi:5-(carboxyamino)imidazole ribonucleotide synthase